VTAGRDPAAPDRARVYPRIRVRGDARVRGRQHGEAVRERVRRSLDAYEEVFAHCAGWDRAKVREVAARFRAPIAAHGQKYLEEIRGIAEGAGAAELDVLALNVRTEIIFAASARDALAGRVARRLPSECSAFAVPAERAGGSLLCGQTWDWLAHAFETTIVLEAEQPDAPDYVTVVEAGLLAKAGLNSAGLALVTNALACDADECAPAVPYHVLLRSILDAETVADAQALLQRGERAASANFLLAHADGGGLDVEAAPGDGSRLFAGDPRADVILHTNHFRNPGFELHDVASVVMPDSRVRLARLAQLVAGHDGPLDRGFWERTLGDHESAPFSICCHPDRCATSDPDRYATVMALIMDPAARRIWLASGNPCEAPFELLDYGDFLGAPSRSWT
jgi:isopenicillin-N N-acyltransferase like protein